MKPKQKLRRLTLSKIRLRVYSDESKKKKKLLAAVEENIAANEAGTSAAAKILETWRKQMDSGMFVGDTLIGMAENYKKLEQSINQNATAADAHRAKNSSSKRRALKAWRRSGENSSQSKLDGANRRPRKSN